MVQEVMPPTIFHHPEFWSLPPDLLSESAQGHTVCLCSDSFTPGNKLHMNESIAVKETREHGGFAGAGVKSFPGTAFIARDPLAGLDFGLWIKSQQR